MKVKDIMTKKVIFVGVEDSITEISKTLVENRIHGVPVVENEKVIGIITETDFFTKGSVGIHLPTYIEFLKDKKAHAHVQSGEQWKIEALLNAKASDVMSSPCITIEEDADCDEFFGLLKGRKLNSVPVVNEKNELVGIITLADIIGLIKMS
jgi:CBS domain-containing protein